MEGPISAKANKSKPGGAGCVLVIVALIATIAAAALLINSFVISSVCAGFIAFIALFLLLAVVSRPKPVVVQHRPPEARDPDAETNHQAAVATGPITLRRSDGGALFGFVFIVIFGVIWNGVVFGALVPGVIASWVSGPWYFAVFLTLFATPFVLVGLGVAIGACALFLSLFNPRVTIAVSRDRVRLGESLELSWRLRKGLRTVRRLQIALIGQEESRYRRGTDDVTDKRIFARINLIDTDDPLDKLMGETEVQVPAETMHSLELEHNSIKWMIEVKGEIPYWPNVDAKFPITLRPLPIEKVQHAAT